MSNWRRRVQDELDLLELKYEIAERDHFEAFYCDAKPQHICDMYWKEMKKLSNDIRRVEAKIKWYDGLRNAV